MFFVIVCVFFFSLKNKKGSDNTFEEWPVKIRSARL